MIKQKVFEGNLKRIGLTLFDKKSLNTIHGDAYKSFIKILYLPKGYELKVDFNRFTTRQKSLFFIAPNQVLQIDTAGMDEGQLIFYNRDFYCIQIHDSEVACDGLLYNNANHMPMISLSADDAACIDPIFEQLNAEYALEDSSQEEMIRTLLKQLLIRSTRIWKKQHLEKSVIQNPGELELFRRFSQLVEAYYKEKHSVSDYADLLFVAAKTITHKFKRLKLPPPNEIIKDRLVLEAKRLLVHTSMTAKEIAYELGYEDPAYFSRQFLLKSGESPSNFRNKFHGLS